MQKRILTAEYLAASFLCMSLLIRATIMLMLYVFIEAHKQVTYKIDRHTYDRKCT